MDLDLLWLHRQDLLHPGMDLLVLLSVLLGKLQGLGHEQKLLLLN